MTDKLKSEDSAALPSPKCPECRHPLTGIDGQCSVAGCNCEADRPVRASHSLQCIAKATDFYFADEDRMRACRGSVHRLNKFWFWTPSGNLDAAICDAHAQIAYRALNERSWLVQKVREVCPRIPSVWAKGETS